MSVAEIAQRQVDLAELHESVLVAAERMAARNVGSLVVVDDHRIPIGILTDRDVTLRAVAPGRDPRGTTVQELMTPRPESLPQEASVEEALAHMREHGLRRLLLTEPDGSLAGVVSLDDIVVHLAEELTEVARLLAKSSPAVLAAT